jgi:hypothetical protein
MFPAFALNNSLNRSDMLGLKIRSLKILETISEQVKIRQKTIKHTPIEKLTDALIAILAGAHGLCEVNTRI